MRYKILFIILTIYALPAAAQQRLYEVSKGIIKFHSDAPHELIRASSRELKGIIDTEHKTFVFKVKIRSFEGFNSPLQREHFNENYMESAKYAEAIFEGKIIEDINFSKEGIYEVRAKGKLMIHGIEQERIIKSQVIVKKGKVEITSVFIVSLYDHDIKIPRVVSDKLAPDINVTVNALLVPKN